MKDLGVAILGHRRKLLNAIAILQAEIGCPSAVRRASGDRQSRRGHRRAPPRHRNVLGPLRFDGALRTYGPGGPTRHHFGLSEMRR
ncbi:SAM domain-containing protein [Bradyrhizobium sp. WSM1743]|uniref:SAM domain-containing protein n=1 Tax=Bradyrhizobium sp. WSM1743 TaxID=318996 RepID=UPI00352960B5